LQTALSRNEPDAPELLDEVAALLKIAYHQSAADESFGGKEAVVATLYRKSPSTTGRTRNGGFQFPTSVHELVTTLGWLPLFVQAHLVLQRRSERLRHDQRT
jgi:hypothetical protein